MVICLFGVLFCKKNKYSKKNYMFFLLAIFLFSAIFWVFMLYYVFFEFFNYWFLLFVGFFDCL